MERHDSKCCIRLACLGSKGPTRQKPAHVKMEGAPSKRRVLHEPYNGLKPSSSDTCCSECAKHTTSVQSVFLSPPGLIKGLGKCQGSQV